MSDPKTAQLDYAPRPPPWHRRPALRRWTVRLAFLAAVCFAVARWGPSAWHHAQLYRSQRQCLAYVAPHGQLIYDSDPFDGTGTAPPPNCWVEVESSLPPPVSLPPIPHYASTRFTPVLGPAPAPSSCIVAARAAALSGWQLYSAGIGCLAALQLVFCAAGSSNWRPCSAAR
jgi:hypothetical protein